MKKFDLKEAIKLKTAICRNGEIAKNIEEWNHASFAIKGHVGTESHSWLADGSWLKGMPNHPLDLVGVPDSEPEARTEAGVPGSNFPPLDPPAYTDSGFEKSTATQLDEARSRIADLKYELTRLRAEVAAANALKAELWRDFQKASRDVESLRAENARLREGLAEAAQTFDECAESAVNLNFGGNLALGLRKSSSKARTVLRRGV